MYPDYVKELFRVQTDIMLKNLEIYHQAVGERIQVVWISGTDFGNQNGLMIGQETLNTGGCDPGGSGLLYYIRWKMTPASSGGEQVLNIWKVWTFSVLFHT